MLNSSRDTAEKFANELRTLLKRYDVEKGALVMPHEVGIEMIRVNITDQELIAGLEIAKHLSIQAMGAQK